MKFDRLFSPRREGRFRGDPEFPGYVTLPIETRPRSYALERSCNTRAKYTFETFCLCSSRAPMFASFSALSAPRVVFVCHLSDSYRVDLVSDPASSSCLAASRLRYPPVGGNLRESVEPRCEVRPRSARESVGAAIRIEVPRRFSSRGSPKAAHRREN